MLNLFEFLVLTHFVVDWLFQTEWEAVNKTKNFFPLAVHSFVYSIGFVPAFYLFQINYAYLVLIFVTHLILDNRKFEFWWLEKVKRTDIAKRDEATARILLFAVDQIFHILILAGLVYWLG